MKALLLSLLFIGACSCASNPPPPVHYSAVPLNSVLGVTFCDGEPTEWVRGSVVLQRPLWQTLAIIAHENDHVRFVHEVGGCASFKAWKAENPANKLALEVRAYCVQARAAFFFSGFSDLESAIRNYSYSLAHPGYGFGVSPEEAEALIRVACRVGD